MADPSRYWFPAKRYGWGWGFPKLWQGWVVLAIYGALVLVGVIVFSPQTRPGVFFAYLVLLTLLLIVVCRVKGEPPRWRWGK